MLLLVSPKNLSEAIEAIEGGADIIDVKNPAEGSLGANFPWVIKEVAKVAKSRGKEVSATTGDMPFKPGTASLAALGAAIAGADYVKVGLYGVRNEQEAEEMVKAVVRAVKDFDREKKVVIAGYGDFYRINSINPLKLSPIASACGADVIMVDTAIKDGTSIFDHLNVENLQKFIDMAKKSGILCALAGNLGWNHVEILKKLSPDIIGIRSAVCEAGRDSRIKRDLVKKLKELVL
ncbi:MAG: (5-formylfuran-3-yl)methyl phosphate synthase [Archaeoglobaceae archaeon]|nr:(5-formylfuran-3-yl)methyl phosphate synthase [Archaeoglobaceae archaeon]MDW7990282.1 (5-formylfuran-3-yl)methyl phosphate synthase [Archaeoglobaceae archaeon]